MFCYRLNIKYNNTLCIEFKCGVYKINKFNKFNDNLFLIWKMKYFSTALSLYTLHSVQSVHLYTK